ncbi:MAG: UDP-N-acetylmuramate dehydrogenase [Oscillospiraceae bacterium]|nr:UDP-N-acetylmuramate dehydrogenase [Oscillospiraceae bacterium]
MDRKTAKALSSINDLRVEKEGDLSLLTGFRTGGKAAVAVPQNKDALIETVRVLRKIGAKHFILGNGSNVLALDEGYDGVVILTREALSQIDADGTVLRAGAGASLADVCRRACREGLTGLEFAYGIPGSVGGAVFMNAGAYGGEMKDVLTEVEYLDSDGQVVTADAAGLGLSYRRSFFQDHRDMVVLSAVFGLSEGDSDVIYETMRETMNKRIEKQPLEYPSCGSTFKRPEGSYASKLIDECGLKGLTVGGAQVSEKHAGFVINRGGATSADILELISRIKETVREMTGYELECEIEFLE